MGRKSDLPLYPLSLNLQGERVLVVGGGSVARRKIGPLLEAGAAVTVVARAFEPGWKHTRAKNLRCVKRAFKLSDLKGARMVFATTDDAALNQRIAKVCRQRGVLVNVATTPEAGNIQIPASVRRGRFSLAVSTGGASAALASVWRQKLERIAGPEWGVLVGLLEKQRQRALKRIGDGVARRAYLQALGRPGWAREIRRHGVRYVATRMNALLDRKVKGKR